MKATYDPLQGFTLDGTDTHLSLGWLLTPKEFSQDCLTLVQRPLYDGWALAAQMPDALVRMMQSPLVPNGAGLALMVSQQGVRYPIVTLQSAGLQVRIVLSLADVATREWLRAVTAAGSITVALEVPETNQIAVVDMPCKVRSRKEVEEFIRGHVELDRQTLLADAAYMLRGLAHMDATPSIIPRFKTQEVRLVAAIEMGSGRELSLPDAKERVLN